METLTLRLFALLVAFVLSPLAFAPFDWMGTCRDRLGRYAQHTTAFWVEASRVNVAALLAARGERIPSESVPAAYEQVHLRRRGVPEGTRREPTEGRIFRQYVETAEQLGRILATSQLRAGRTPYVVLHDESYRETYVDMTGIFLTHPRRRSEQVGLHAGLAYVDFRLPTGTDAVRLEAGIYLIPGAPDRMRIPIEIVGSSPGT